MRVLVTGAAGMLGQAVMPALAAAGHEAIGLDLPELDVTDEDSVRGHFGAFRPEWVMHLAAFTKVDECESREKEAFRVNALGAKNVGIAAAGVRAWLLALSTDYVFDGTATRPYREDDATNPVSAYGRSKRSGEGALAWIGDNAGNPHFLVRTSWLFGPGGPNFVDTILAKARAGEALRVVDDQRGSPTYTHDLAEGLLRLMAAEKPSIYHCTNSGDHQVAPARLAHRLKPGIYHCTNSGDCTWYDLAAYALGRAGLRVPLERTDTASFPRPAKRPAYSVLSNGRFQQVTGWRMPAWRDAVTRHLALAAGGTGGKA